MESYEIFREWWPQGYTRTLKKYGKNFLNFPRKQSHSQQRHGWCMVRKWIFNGGGQSLCWPYSILLRCSAVVSACRLICGILPSKWKYNTECSSPRCIIAESGAIPLTFVLSVDDFVSWNYNCTFNTFLSILQFFSRSPIQPFPVLS